ncbi:MAG: ATP-binding protein [Desulfuromonadia bacterium]
MQLAEPKGYNQPMPATDFYPRFAADRLTEALDDSPAALIHGPRQCGKTTLAQRVGTRTGYAYFSFDDEAIRSAATADPVGFVADLPPRAILDEVQHVPHLFVTLKAAIDRDRRPGRLMLTGSTNVLLLPKLSDSLAGRMAIVRLHPLAQCELTGTHPAFLDRLFGEGFKMRPFERLGPVLHERVAAGGYPAALKLPPGRRRARWYEGYLETIVQRDVRELARIASLDAVPRLLAAAAAQTARLVNVSELAAPFQLSRPTIRDYLTLLARTFLLEELPPWHANRLSRLVKTPKLHVGDTGLACALLGAGAKALGEDRALLGQLLETFVFQELRRQASWHDEPHAFYHFRDRDGYEVDIVVERGGRAVAGIEVKAAATVTAADFRGLRKLKDAAGRRFAGGVVLHDGTMSVRFGEGLFAVPIRALWEAP